MACFSVPADKAALTLTPTFDWKGLIAKGATIASEAVEKRSREVQPAKIQQRQRGRAETLQRRVPSMHYVSLPAPLLVLVP